jgi:hypothetical protein
MRKLGATEVVNVYREAAKFAPPRYLSLRLHPSRWAEIMELAIVPESIQVATIPGNLGKKLIKLACVPVPNGTPQGVTVKLDPQAKLDELVFEVHGVAAYTYKIPE